MLKRKLARVEAEIDKITAQNHCIECRKGEDRQEAIKRYQQETGEVIAENDFVLLIVRENALPPPEDYLLFTEIVNGRHVMKKIRKA